MKKSLLFLLLCLLNATAIPQITSRPINFESISTTFFGNPVEITPDSGTITAGYAIITGTSAIRNCGSVAVDDEYYTICYEKSLKVSCDEKSPTGNSRKTIYVDHDGDGHHDKVYYLFAGYKYNIWLNSSGFWVISQAL